MNPLQRRLFRLQQPGMSRQPMGILASSPELMLAAQRGATQPLKMNQGGSVGQYMQTIQQLKQAGDKSTLNNIATDQRLPRSIQMAAANALAGIEAQASQPSQQVPLAATDKLGSLASGTPVMAVRGSGDEVPVTVGVNPENLLTDATGPKRIGQSEGGRERSAKLAQVPGKIAEGVGSVFDEITRTRGPAVMDIVGPFPDSPLKKFARSFTAGDKLQAMPDESSLEAVSGEAPTSILGAPEVLGTVFGAGEAAKPKGTIAEQIAAGMKGRGDFPDRPSGYTPSFPTAAESMDEFGNIAPDGSMPGEILAATTSPPSKPQTGDDKSKSKASGKLLSPAALLQNVYGTTTKKSDFTTAFENDVTNFNQQFLTGVTENKEAVIDAQNRLTEASKLFDDAISKKRATAKEFSLEDVRDEALKISGIDKTDYDENRKDAFWMGLMRAGLAIAAGESENTLTNVAKGLGFGLEGYGKDIATLNAQEREDRKELRAISMDLVKTKNDRAMAVAAAENDFNYNQQRLAQAAVQGADAALLQAQNREATHKMNGLQLQANLSYQLNTLKQADKKLAADTAYKNWALQISMLPDEAKKAMLIEGNGGFNPETGKFELTQQGETYYKSLVEAATTSRYSITDLDKGASAAADVGNVQGIPLSSDPATARSQALVWASQYQDAFDAAAKDPVGGEETQKRLLDRFGQAIGGGSTQLQTTFNETPSDEVLQSLYDQGVREINVAGQIRPLNIEG